MKCTVCDEPLEPGTLFCPNCGARVTTIEEGGKTIALPKLTNLYDPPPLESDAEASQSTSLTSAPNPIASQSYAPPQSYVPPQSYTPPQPYDGQYYIPVTTPNSTAAVVSLVFGLLAWFGLLGLGAIVAVIAGHIARSEIRRSNGQLSGNGMATAGLILGYAQIILGLLACGFFAVLIIIGSATPHG